MYSPVKADLAGNIKVRGGHHPTHGAAAPGLGRGRPPGPRTSAPLQKIRAVYDSNPSKFKTLQNILEVEKEMHGAAWPKTGATLALMWLKR